MNEKKIYIKEILKMLWGMDLLNVIKIHTIVTRYYFNHTPK